MGSIQLVSLGIIAEYIRRIFVESKGRPTYVVRATRGLPDRASDAPASTPARRLRPPTEDGIRSYTTPARRADE
jgi:hypothetical protein